MKYYLTADDVIDAAHNAVRRDVVVMTESRYVFSYPDAYYVNKKYEKEKRIGFQANYSF